MKYKDYYAILGVPRTATTGDIKKAYRKLAHLHHPDVAKQAGAEERFKEIAEAYATLKDTAKRAAYDQLGEHGGGQEFRPPPGWGERYSEAGGGEGAFEDIDLGDLFARFRSGAGPRQAGRAGHGGGAFALPGQDYEVAVEITLEQAMSGTEVALNFSAPEFDARGELRRTEHHFSARIPKGATDGQRLRVPGRGGKGLNGGRSGDLYLQIHLAPHRLYRPSGHDLYLDLPLAPWEAVIGTSLEVPTPAGPVQLKVPPGSHAGQKLRLSKRGLPRPSGDPGDLYAIVQIATPERVGDDERALYEQLAKVSTFRPRAHFGQEERA